MVAAAFAEGAPTGIDAVDAVYRAGLVVLLVLAGERARRWSLLLGSGLTAVFAVGAPRAGALAALVIILAMVVSDRRSRVMDALVGGLVGVAALALQAGGPLGVETLLAAVATVPILYSAYTYTSKRVQTSVAQGSLLVLRGGGAVHAAGRCRRGRSPSVTSRVQWVPPVMAWPRPATAMVPRRPGSSPPPKRGSPPPTGGSGRSGRRPHGSCRWWAPTSPCSRTAWRWVST